MKREPTTPGGARWRTFRALALAALLALAAVLAACGGGDDESSGSTTAGTGTTQTAGSLEPGDGTIDVATWETYHDDPWVAQAEKDLGLKINITRMGSVDEMYAKVRANPDQYDLYLVDSGSIQRYIDSGLIAPVDTAALRNLGQINPGLNYRETNVIDGQTWAIPYNWGVQPLVFDRSKVPETARETWNTLWDTRYKGAVMIPDDAYITLPMIALAAGIDPFRWSDADYQTIADKLTALRSQIRTLTKSFNEQETMMRSGDAVVGYAQAYQYVARDPKLGMSFPREGVPFWLDNYFFSKRGSTDEDVYKFVDYTLQDQWQCRFANETFQNGILSKERAKACFRPEVYAGDGGNLVSRLTPELGRSFVLLQAPADLDRRLELWNTFKSGA